MRSNAANARLLEKLGVLTCRGRATKSVCVIPGTAASGAKRTSVDKRQKQAGGMHVVPIGQNEHMHCSNPAREVARNPTVAVVGLKDPGSYLR